MLFPQFPPELRPVVLSSSQLRFQMRNERVELAGLWALGGPLRELAGSHKAAYGRSAELKPGRYRAYTDALGVEFPHLRVPCLEAVTSLLTLVYSLIRWRRSFCGVSRWFRITWCCRRWGDHLLGKKHRWWIGRWGLWSGGCHQRILLSIKQALQHFTYVLEQMEAVSNLERIGRTTTGAFGIVDRAVTGDHIDAWLILQPLRDHLGGAILDQIYGLMGFQVDQQSTIPLTCTQRNVVDAQAARGWACILRRIPDQTKQGIGADVHALAPC